MENKKGLSFIKVGKPITALVAALMLIFSAGYISISVNASRPQLGSSQHRTVNRMVNPTAIPANHFYDVNGWAGTLPRTRVADVGHNTQVQATFAGNVFCQRINGC